MMTATEHVILVDQEDNPLGSAEKLIAHQKGLCHRAFSVFILREHFTPEILLQQRGANKYHSPNLWTNTCCSHPRPGEDIVQAGERRLQEEMGIKTHLKWVGKFHYVAEFNNGLIENEVDHVLVGWIPQNESFKVNGDEVQSYRWISFSDLKTELMAQPESFTPWLKEALKTLRSE